MHQSPPIGYAQLRTFAQRSSSAWFLREHKTSSYLLQLSVPTISKQTPFPNSLTPRWPTIPTPRSSSSTANQALSTQISGEQAEATLHMNKMSSNSCQLSDQSQEHMSYTSSTFQSTPPRHSTLPLLRWLSMTPPFLCHQSL